MAHIIVEEQYSETFSEDRVKAAGRIIDAELANKGGKWKRTYRSSALKREICEFDAPNEQVVKEAYQAAGLSPERIYTAELADEQRPDWH